MILIGNRGLRDLRRSVGSVGRCGEDRRCTSPTGRNLQNRAPAEQSRLCNHVTLSLQGRSRSIFDGPPTPAKAGLFHSASAGDGERQCSFFACIKILLTESRPAPGESCCWRPKLRLRCPASAESLTVRDFTRRSQTFYLRIGQLGFQSATAISRPRHPLGNKVPVAASH